MVMTDTKNLFLIISLNKGSKHIMVAVLIYISIRSNIDPKQYIAGKFYWHQWILLLDDI